MKLRGYQNDAVESVFNYFRDNEGNPLVVMPTGTGKSLVIADFCKRAITTFAGTKIMMLTHVKELIVQDFDKLRKLWPAAPCGIYSAGLKKKDAFYPVTFGGIGSVSKANLEIFGRIDLVIIDEAHLVSNKDETMYRKTIAALKEINPHLKVIGLTATDYRLGQGRLAGEGNLFTDVCIDMSKKESFNWFIAQGYLVPLVPKKANMTVDTKGIKMRGGEFVDKDAQAAIDKNEITLAACKEMVAVAHAENRHHWLIFSTGIEHAIHIASMLDSMGIDVRYIHSKMKEAERDKNIADFIDGKFTALVNNGILTTGFDYPELDMIAMMRLTMSSSLWVQMLGRGTRPYYTDGYNLETLDGRLAAIAASSKKNCLVLDFAGNTRRLGPVNDPVIPQAKGKGTGDAPIKVCDACLCYNHASVRFCENCGEEFPRHYKVKEKAGTDDLIAKTDEKKVTEIFNVDTVTYRKHARQGKIPSLKVTYSCNLRSFTEYICLEHFGFPAKKARDWWRFSSSSNGIPKTVDEALSSIDILRKPTRIRVLLNRAHPEILNYEYQ